MKKYLDVESMGLYGGETKPLDQARSHHDDVLIDQIRKQTVNWVEVIFNPQQSCTCTHAYWTGK